MFRTLTLSLALLGASALPALAHPLSQNKEGARSRAEVLAELDAARRDGSLARMNREGGHAPEYEQRGSRTRDEVRAELDAARRSGYMARLNRESGLPLEPMPLGKSISRAEVLAELEHARADGSMRCSLGNRGSC